MYTHTHTHTHIYTHTYTHRTHLYQTCFCVHGKNKLLQQNSFTSTFHNTQFMFHHTMFQIIFFLTSSGNYGYTITEYILLNLIKPKPNLQNTYIGTVVILLLYLRSIQGRSCFHAFLLLTSKNNSLMTRVCSKTFYYAFLLSCVMISIHLSTHLSPSQPLIDPKSTSKLSYLNPMILKPNICVVISMY